ncbi:MAG: hypothetical protein AAFQ95_21995 [Cyanobacteria bacterium J06621_3]
MKILGIRNAPQQLRYAITLWDGNKAVLLNSDGENLLKVPASINTDLPKKLHWFSQELNRILRQNEDVSCIALKSNEYGPKRESSTSRVAAYFDGVVYLIAGQHNLPIHSKLYRQIGTKRAEVVNFAEDKVGSAKSNWNIQMADAVAITWSCVR